MKTVYVEKGCLNQPRTERILQKIKPKHIIECDHYKEVFNPRQQNFRIQKKQPSLIIAQKLGQRVCPSPPSFGIGGKQNYYFSHMLNCLYDCRYCFLQGMYSSANYVVFVNYEDFMEDIKNLTVKGEAPIYFFSGYDCDSLAYEPVTEFVKEFIPFFREQKSAFLELRTKSTNVNVLLEEHPFANCVVAFSFTPEEISSEIEHKVPSVLKRLTAMKKVAEQGWMIGLRFDPLIYHPEFKKIYTKLIDDIFKHLDSSSLHSVSLGPLRFPDKMYQKIVRLYPHDALFSQPLHFENKIFSYPNELEQSMKQIVNQQLIKYIDHTLLFECHV